MRFASGASGSVLLGQRRKTNQRRERALELIDVGVILENVSDALHQFIEYPRSERFAGPHRANCAARR